MVVLLPSMPLGLGQHNILVFIKFYYVPDMERTMRNRTSKAFLKEHTIQFLPAVDITDLS